MIIEFKKENISKGELCERLFPLTKDRTFDYDTSIPMGFINLVNSRFINKDLESFGNIASHFVWFYDNDNRVDYPMPLTKIGVTILARLSMGVY